MNEEKSLSEREEDFIDYVRRKRGPCPENDALIAYQEQTLSSDQAEPITAHVRFCGSCQLGLQMLERYERLETEELPEPPNWPDVEKRSRERFAAFLKQQPAPAPERPSFFDRLRSVFLHPAVAYVLLAALAYPAYRGLFGEPKVVREVIKEPQIVEVEKPTPDIAALRTFELRLPERAVSQGITTVRLAPDDRFFALAFFAPISERPELVYDVEIHDSQGRLVAEEKAARPQDQLGNFLLVCRRELFSSGAYELQVKEMNTTTQVLAREFKFLFTVAEMK
jgi:hypothetical protein